MLRSTLVSALFTVAGFAASAHAAPLQEGRSIYRHHHYHAAHYYEMTHRHHHHHDGSYAGGGHDQRSTATGGNPGGYADRN